MNGDDPQHFARIRREPPPGRPGEPPAYPPRPAANPGQSQRPSSQRPHADGRPVNDGRPRIEPTQVIRRHESGPDLAYSQVPPGNPAPRQRPLGNHVPPHHNRGPGMPPQGNRVPPPRDRAAAPMGHAPTQQPVPFREEPPRTPPPPPPGKRRGGDGRPPRGSRPRRKRHWFRWILSLLLVLLLLPIAAAIYVDTHLTRIDALANYSGRIGDTPGTNWLLVGSDSRSGLSKGQEQELSTGDSSDVEGERTDTVILVHIPKSGRPTLVSLPRDSYVSIPGVGKDKLNASFASGGASLLVKTVEGATGVHIDHYVQIGFGGFANVVDAVGGIQMCLDAPMKDPLAGIDLPAGCQTLNGPEALGFVRSRATPRADLDRMLNQRKFLSALLKKAASPATLANPFRSWPLVRDLTSALKVDKGAHIWDLASLGNALNSDPITTTVPVGGFEDVAGSGNVLLWDKTKASAFFDALAKDQQIPQDLITTVGS
ncbi:LCP family protein [Nocardia sp. CA-151230]|uniref:LCP family protein n=1 Tax=Nocardia sp. CA-151230 TaxID=3239982 RepID=UPI003D8C96C0